MYQRVLWKEEQLEELPVGAVVAIAHEANSDFYVKIIPEYCETINYPVWVFIYEAPWDDEDTLYSDKEMLNRGMIIEGKALDDFSWATLQ